MSLDDIEYYRRRAREERARARKTDIPEAAKAHLDLAVHYEALDRARRPAAADSHRDELS